MTDRPLIVRAILAEDWYAAYEAVLAADTPQKMAKPDGRPAWSRARLMCLLQAEEAMKAGGTELEGAWSLLGADPAGPQFRSLAGGRTYVPALRELGRAIVADPALLDDEKFCEAAEGWRFLEVAGSDGEDDLIVAARKYGAMGRIDKETILAWAKMWSEIAYG